MWRLPTFDISWSDLFDLWNEISYEKGISPSFKEIIILEPPLVEGIEPCQGFDWLSVEELKGPIKSKKRTISYDFGKYTTHVAHAPKASLQTLKTLLENNRDEEALVSIALIATAKQFLGKLPNHWRGWNFRFLEEVEICCKRKASQLSYPPDWSHSSKWLFPKGFYSEEVIDETHNLDESIFVELALRNLAYYCESHRPCYYLRTDVDDVSRFENLMMEIGIKTVFHEIERGSSNEKDAPKENQSARIKKEIEDHDKLVHHREGKMVERRSVAYERSPQARKECLRHYGYECAICGMDFGKEFGEEFSEVIEVHHLKPLSLLKEEREIDPIRDLVPLCPNCHKMAHRKTGKPYTLDQLRNIRKASISS